MGLKMMELDPKKLESFEAPRSARGVRGVQREITRLSNKANSSPGQPPVAPHSGCHAAHVLSRPHHLVYGDPAGRRWLVIGQTRASMG